MFMTTLLFVCTMLAVLGTFLWCKLELALVKEEQSITERLRHRALTTLILFSLTGIVALIGSTGQLLMAIGNTVATQCTVQK
jgi:hypothetical protein